MPETTQSFANHSRFPGSLVANSSILLVATVASGAGLAMHLNGSTSGLALTLIGLGNVVTGATAIAVAIMCRTYALTLQDRIIRLEMQVRMARVLPAELQQRCAGLSLGHLIALRFASDEELAELVRQILDKGIEDRASIKKMIRNWQADHQRV